jgi:peroxiredoxin
MRTILAILLGAATLVAADPPRRAPGFAITDRDMKVHDLYDYRGKPVILEFMQTSCPHCAAFSEVLNRVKDKFGDKVTILAVANPPDNYNTVGQFIAAHKIGYPILFDMGQVAYSYVLKPSFDLPQVYLIDAQGMIVSTYAYGPMTREVFEGDALIGEVERMLAAPAPAPTQKKAAPATKKQ